MRLFPRLEAATARELANHLRGLSIRECHEEASSSMEGAYFPPSGGAPVVESDLHDLAEAMRTAARDLGYPDAASRTSKAEFDVVSASVLHQQMAISSSEASEESIWAYLTCRLMPDLVMWRFGPDPSVEHRFLTRGRAVRNTFARLWWRWQVLAGESMDDKVLRELGEDQLVQIMERPTLASDRRLARSIGEAFLSYPDHVRSEELMRDAMKRFQRLGGFVRFETLTEGELEAEVVTVFEESFEFFEEEG